MHHKNDLTFLSNAKFELSLEKVYINTSDLTKQLPKIIHMIPDQILLQYEARLIHFNKNDIIFHQSDNPRFYYQIKTGKVAMTTLNEDGKEFTQGVFYDGESFGEPPLFIDEKYPSTAAAIEDSEVYQVDKDVFISILSDYPEYSLALNTKLSKLLYFKSKMATEISLYDPEHRIMTLLNFLKEAEDGALQKVELTRQQIANLTALRVETAIRAIKSLEEKGELKIINRKVYF